MDKAQEQLCDDPTTTGSEGDYIPTIALGDLDEMTQYDLQCAAWEHASDLNSLDFDLLADAEDGVPLTNNGVPISTTTSNLEACYEQGSQSKNPTTTEAWHLEASAAGNTVQAEITVPVNKVGLVIGRNGRTIKAFQEKTGTKMHIIQDLSKLNLDDPTVEIMDKTMLIIGEPEAVMQAEEMVRSFLANAPSSPPSRNGQEEQRDNGQSLRNHLIHDPSFRRFRRGPQQTGKASSSSSSGRIKTVRIPVPKFAVGLIIGKGGESIKKIRLETGAKIQFSPLNMDSGDSAEQIAIVSGKGEEIQHACDWIEKLVEAALSSSSSGLKDGRGGTAGEHQPYLSSSSSSCAGRAAQWSQSCMDCLDHHGHHSAYPHEEIEEDRFGVPAEVFGRMKAEGRDDLSAISEMSGASCTYDAYPADGLERFVFLKGTRTQIEHAKQIIMENAHTEGKIPEFDPGNGKGSCHYGETGDLKWNSHQDHQQQQLPNWSYYQPSYYEPLQTGFQEYCVNPPPAAPLLIPVGDFGMQPPLYASASCSSQSPNPEQQPSSTSFGDQEQQQQQQHMKHEPVPPVPIMSATIIHNTGTNSSMGPPHAVYFFVPAGPFPPPPTAPPPPPTTTTTAPPAPSTSPAPGHMDEPITVSAADYPEKTGSSLNADGDHHKLEPAEPAVVSLHLKADNVSGDPLLTASGSGDAYDGHASPSSSSAGKDDENSSGSTPKFEPYLIGGESVVGSAPSQPNSSMPDNPLAVGTPGSCTRIVSFYYDLNVNSIIIHNQWHFF